MASPPDDETRSLTGTQRALLVLAALGVLLVAFVVIRGGEDQPHRSASPAPATQAPATSEPAPVPTPDHEAQPEPESPPVERTIRVVGGQPSAGARTLTFVKGERVAFEVVSDVADEIHVHGYDLRKDVAPGATARYAFKATIEGRFEIELENAGTLIATLEVAPS